MFSFVLSYFTQTLTTLDLGNDEIGLRGAEHLNEALQTNTVRKEEENECIHCVLLFYIDTYYTESFVQSNWRQRIETSERCFTNKQGRRGRKKQMYPVYFFVFFVISYRHLLRWISGIIESESKEQNILVKLYEQTQ